jgi:hypothetical protein
MDSALWEMAADSRAEHGIAAGDHAGAEFRCLLKSSTPESSITKRPPIFWSEWAEKIDGRTPKV